MSATMARQGDRVQLEQSHIPLTLSLAKIAKGEFSRAAIQETQQMIMKPRAKVREEKKRGAGFTVHKKVKAAMERHLAMVYRNHTAGCLPCQNVTAKNPETRWRRNEIAVPPTEPAAPPPERPPLPGTPPPTPDNNDGHESYQIDGMPSKCVYLHSSPQNT